MINKNEPRKRVLALAPTARGIGFAVLEPCEKLAAWGVKSVTGDKNASSLEKIRALIVQYRPESVAVEDFDSNPLRSKRVRALGLEISKLAELFEIPLSAFSVSEMRQPFFGDDAASKQQLAEHLAQLFPDELGDIVPRKRQPWMPEAYSMAIFEAVALALAGSRGSYDDNCKRTANENPHPEGTARNFLKLLVA